MIIPYLKLMRIQHYIKNTLVFAALVCSGLFFVWDMFLSALIGFICFCFLSSVVYIINDICDRKKDCMHPVKCNRPIASGAVSVQNGILLAIVLFVAAFGCNALVFHFSSSLMMVFYFLLNLTYSFGLKNIPIVDVCILVAGFLIRVLYGAVITGIEVSSWLYMTVIAISFYFALGKRRNEIKKISNGKTRAVLKAYSVSFLDKNMYMCLTLANVFYALWSMDENTISFYNNRYIGFTVPIVLLITMKYSMDIEGDCDGDPVEVLLHDKILIILCVVYFMLMLAILYLR